MPHFGENSDIWPIYQPSKLKSRFLGTSFPRLTFLKSGGDPVYDNGGNDDDYIRGDDDMGLICCW